MTTPSEPTCETCRYRSNEVCHRYPPVAIDEDVFYFPEIDGGDWCGEHSPRIPLSPASEHKEGEYINAHLIAEAVARERKRILNIVLFVLGDALRPNPYSRIEERVNMEGKP